MSANYLIVRKENLGDYLEDFINHRRGFKKLHVPNLVAFLLGNIVGTDICDFGALDKITNKYRAGHFFQHAKKKGILLYRNFTLENGNVLNIMTTKCNRSGDNDCRYVEGLITYRLT